ncbi:hypothetical protein C0Q70_17448 [Pomacea canaliculata]|uniref:Uncharacterized protein n=1 Tax=Pomacea canaliculata TaxID=400727 RepID=A0A2T7NKG4_POMCA|nr:hypothetical protein C0Q70_17448 [Pomacea canaliculata]
MVVSPAQEQDTTQPNTTEDLLQELNQDAQQLTKDGSKHGMNITQEISYQTLMSREEVPESCPGNRLSEAGEQTPGKADFL